MTMSGMSYWAINKCGSSVLSGKKFKMLINTNQKRSHVDNVGAWVGSPAWNGGFGFLFQGVNSAFAQEPRCC